MAEKKAKRRGRGRPEVPLDYEQMEKLLELHCTLEEVAGFFGCDRRTIERRVLKDRGVNFATFSEAPKGRGRIRLRRRQFQKAYRGEGDTKMLIWLGKQHLNQAERQEWRGSVGADGEGVVRFSMDIGPAGAGKADGAGDE